MSLYDTVPILGQIALYSSFILLQNLEDHVNAAKSCSEIIQMIKIFWKKAVHPNHFLVFRLWDKFYFTSHKVSELLEYYAWTGTDIVYIARLKGGPPQVA